MGTRKMLKSKPRFSHATEPAGDSAWKRQCGKCKRQCNERGLSRDGLSECPAGGRHHLS